MAKIEVRIKYTNRVAARVYLVGNDDTEFATIKDAIKATGAKFTGSHWNVSAEGLKTLKAQFEVQPFDFKMNYDRNTIALTADDTTVYIAESREDMLEKRELFQAAYSKSDEEFRNVFQSIVK